MEIYVVEWCERDGGGFSHANLTLEGAQQRTAELDADFADSDWIELSTPDGDSFWDSGSDQYGGFYRIRLVEVGP